MDEACAAQRCLHRPFDCCFSHMTCSIRNEASDSAVKCLAPPRPPCSCLCCRRKSGHAAARPGHTRLHWHCYFFLLSLMKTTSSEAVDPTSCSWPAPQHFDRQETAVHQERPTMSGLGRTGGAAARQVRTEPRRQAQGPQVPAQPAHGSRGLLFGDCTKRSQM